MPVQYSGRYLVIDKNGRSFTLHTEEPEIPLYNDDCLYTPGVIVLKVIFHSGKNGGKRLVSGGCSDLCSPKLTECTTGNFMNPCAGDEPADITEDALYKLHLKRGENLGLAATNKGRGADSWSVRMRCLLAIHRRLSRRLSGKCRKNSHTLK